MPGVLKADFTAKTSSGERRKMERKTGRRTGRKMVKRKGKMD